MAAAATTNSDAKTNFFIRPSAIANRLWLGCLFERQTKALSLMIYDNGPGGQYRKLCKGLHCGDPLVDWLAAPRAKAANRLANCGNLAWWLHRELDLI